MKKLLLATSLLIGGLALSTQAQDLGLQFWTSGQANNGPLLLTQVAGVVPQDNFNTIDLNTVITDTFPLFDSSHAPVAATFTLTNNNDAYFTGTSTSTANGTLLSGQSGDYSRSPVTYTFNGLQPGTYDLILYTVTNVAGQNAELSLVLGTTSGPTNYFDLEQNGSDFTGAFIQGSATTEGASTTANYVEFTGVTPQSVTIEISDPDLGTLPYVDAVNGIQLIETPEPPTVLLTAIAALALLGVVWKSRAACRA